MRSLLRLWREQTAGFVAMAFFLLFVFALGAANLAVSVPEWAEKLPGESFGFNRPTFTRAEELFNEDFAGKMGFVELHGAMQRAMGKREVGNFDVVKDGDGNLLPGYAGTNVLVPREEYTAENLDYLYRFQQYCNSGGQPFLFVQLPNWIVEGYTELPAGVAAYQNQNDDEKLAVIEGFGIDTLDLRKQAQEDGLDPSALFFKTDHHWTIDTAFWASSSLLRTFSGKYGFNYANLEKITDPANYHRDVYENWFLGSAGRRTGRVYGGLDDFTLITPAFKTELTLVNKSHFETPRTGPFDEVVVNRDLLEARDSLSETLRYDVYLSGFTPEATLLNEGGQKRVLVVQDSYGQTASAFMALACHEVTMLDFRYYEGGTLAEYIAQNGPYDLVVSLGQLHPEKFI